MPQVEVVSFDAHARKNYNLADNGRVGSITWLCRRPQPEF
jgi:hypothetical protein